MQNVMARKNKPTATPESESEFDQVDSSSENGQGELPEMPASSPVGKAGRAYLKVKLEMDSAIEDFKERKGKTSLALIEEMEKIDKESINVDGYILTRKHAEVDKITVKSPSVSD